MNLDTSQLRAFVTVAKLKSFSQASVRLCRVQSAISQQIQKLEKQVNAVLFIRNRNGVKLTVQGERLLPYAVKMLSINDEAAAALCEKQPKGSLRIGTSDTYATCFLQDILMSSSERCPELQIEVHCGYSEAIWSKYEKGELDIVLTQRSPHHINSEILHVEPLLWMCSKTSDVYRKNPVPLALFSEGCADREVVLNALIQTGKDYTLGFHSTSHAGILAAVSSGNYVSAILASTSNHNFKVLTDADDFPPLGNLEISMAYNDHTDSASTQMFADVIKEYFRWFSARKHSLKAV